MFGECVSAYVATYVHSLVLYILSACYCITRNPSFEKVFVNFTF